MPRIGKINVYYGIVWSGSLYSPLLSNWLSFSQVVTANHVKLQMSEGSLSVHVCVYVGGWVGDTQRGRSWWVWRGRYRRRPKSLAVF